MDGYQGSTLGGKTTSLVGVSVVVPRLGLRGRSTRTRITRHKDDAGVTKTGPNVVGLEVELVTTTRTPPPPSLLHSCPPGVVGPTYEGVERERSTFETVPPRPWGPAPSSLHTPPVQGNGQESGRWGLGRHRETPTLRVVIGVSHSVDRPS